LSHLYIIHHAYLVSVAGQLRLSLRGGGGILTINGEKTLS